MSIKALIFDLDGVLVHTGDVHLQALNKALAEISTDYFISKEDDSKYYGTVPTAEKLKIFSARTGMSIEFHSEILQKKKKYTMELINSSDVTSFFSLESFNCLSFLHSKLNIPIYIASNTNREFVNNILDRTHLKQFITKVYTNQDVNNPKPHPEIYMKCMLDAGVSPDETLIFEDSVTGQIAAVKSGANVYPIESPNDLDLSKILEVINTSSSNQVKWKSKKINVLIPMAGQGSRFTQAGYKTPKPLIPVDGLPMVGLVADKLNIDANFIFVVKGEHCDEYKLETILPLLQPNCSIVKAWGPQGGAVCSVLAAKELINNDNHLLIVNSDQIWEWDANEFYYQMIREDLDGGIVTFVDDDRNPKWSFAKIDENGFVTEVAEKKPISNLGTAGIYYYKKGSDFVKYAEQMIDKNIKVNNEFYVCPVYNEFIEDNKKIKTFNCNRMIGLGTPEDLELYFRNR